MNIANETAPAEGQSGRRVGALFPDVAVSPSATARTIRASVFMR